MIVRVPGRIEVADLLLKLILVVQLQPDCEVNGLSRIGSAQILRFADPARGIAAYGGRVWATRVCEGETRACPRHDGKGCHKSDDDGEFARSFHVVWCATHTATLPVRAQLLSAERTEVMLIRLAHQHNAMSIQMDSGAIPNGLYWLGELPEVMLLRPAYVDRVFRHSLAASYQ